MKPEDKIVHGIISTAVNHHFLEQVKYSPLFEKDLKHKVNIANKALIKHSRLFEILESEVEDSSIDVHDVFWDFIKEVSATHIQDMGELTAVIRAFKEDKKSILGIAKKILK